RSHAPHPPPTEPPAAPPAARYARGQCLPFLPLAHGRGSLRPTFGKALAAGTGFGIGSLMSSGLRAGPGAAARAADAAGDVGVAVGPRAIAAVSGPWVRAVRLSSASMFSNAWRLDALRNSPVQICKRTFCISSSKYLNASLLYSTSGSFWP